MKTYLYRASNLKSTITFWPLFHSTSKFLVPSTKRRFLLFFIRKYGSTLCVGLARAAVQPTNTNFQLTF